ncbi:MAG: regulator SirB [Proteobacteria bacterium]|nr:MAG: regulator SirB [Pseudomonadota bacterium]
MLDYSLIKFVHVGCVVASGAGFLVRGTLMLVGSPWLAHRLTRTLPHVVDTLLLASAVTLVVMSGYYPGAHPWVAAKIAALALYIVLGSLALKRGRSRRVRGVSLVLALATFAYIVAVALSRSPFVGLPV